MNKVNWTRQFINTLEDVEAIDSTIKNGYEGKFRVNEIVFMTKALRQAFQSKIKDKFFKVYSGALKDSDRDIDRLFNRDMHTWITPYGTIQLTDFEETEQ